MHTRTCLMYSRKRIYNMSYVTLCLTFLAAYVQNNNNDDNQNLSNESSKNLIKKYDVENSTVISNV